MTVELDYMEYANDAAAQAAYVSSKPFSYTLEENYESGLDHYRIIFGMGGNSEKVAQEFQLSSGITCGKISAYLKKVGNPADNVTCRVETDAAGKPSGNLVHANATKSIAGSGISGAGDWAVFEFAATFSLSSGTIYHIVILRSGARDTDNYYGWGNSEVAGSYPDGSLEYSNNGVWDNLLASDGYFRIYSAAVALQCYSESGVVQQGTYSLAVAANSPDALNQTLIRTIGAPIDLSGMGGAYLYIRTTLRTGSNIKIGIHDSGGVTTEITPNVAATGAWQKVEWVLTGVADADKDAIDQIIITIVNADASEIFFLDNIYAIAPVNVTVEPDPLSVSSSLPAPSITEGQGVTISADPFSISASIPQVEVATGIASFATLASIPNSQKDFMCVITPKKRYTAWTKTGGQTNVYQMSWANLFLASADFGYSYRDVSSVEHNGTALSVQGSVAAVDSNQGSYYHDSSGGVLYIHTTDSSNPANQANYIVVFMNIYVGSKGKIFNKIYYEPLFSGLNVPSITYEQTDILAGGGLATAEAVLEFLNHRGFWNQIWSVYSWKNADVRLYYGGESLPFGEYQLIWFAYIREEHWSERAVWFDTVNYIDLLKRNVPITPLFGDNVSASDRGKPVPICIGANTGVTPLCSDDSAADATEWTIADPAYQTLKSIDAVYDGDSDVTVHVTKDLTNCKFTFNSYAPTGKVTCDVKGAKISDIPGESDTGLMTKASDIVRYVLLRLVEIPSSKLNSASFAAALAANPFDLCRYIRYRRNSSSYIAEIEKSVMGNLRVNNSGEWQFDIYEPSSSEDDSLNDAELGRFEQHAPIDKIFTGIKVFYNPTPYERDETSPIAESEDATYEVVEGTNSRAKYEDKQTAVFKPIYTWIKDKANAETHRDRMLLLTDAQAVEIDADVKGIKLFRRWPGNVLSVTREKAATSTGAMSGMGFTIVRIVKEFAQNSAKVLLTNMMGLGLYVGLWSASGAPAWSAATDEEKQQQGFWSDPDGYIDPSDPGGSYKKSIWW